MRSERVLHTTMDDTADMDEEDIYPLSAIQGFSEETPNTPPPPPVLVPAVLELNAQPQPDSNGGYNECVPLGEDPELFEELWSMLPDSMYDGAVQAEDMQPDYPCSQADIRQPDYPCSQEDIRQPEYPCSQEDIRQPEYPCSQEDIRQTEYPCSQEDIRQTEYPCSQEDIRQTEYPCSQADIRQPDYPCSQEDIRQPEYPCSQEDIRQTEYPCSQEDIRQTEYPCSQEDIRQTEYPCSQAGSYSQGQYLPFMSSRDCVTSAAAVGHTAPPPPPPPPPPHPNNDLPVVRLREGENLRFIGVMPNGQMLYRVEDQEDHFAPPVLAAPPPNASTSKKRKFNKQQDDRPHVRKPLNAFMLFMKEQRAEVKLSEGNKSGGNAAVNTILGQRWSSMTSEDQAKYYAMAQKEKELHAQQHPDWCCKNNYGTKRKRRRGKASV